jgi:hypothetical protein
MVAYIADEEASVGFSFFLDIPLHHNGARSGSTVTCWSLALAGSGQAPPDRFPTYIPFLACLIWVGS